MKMEVHNIMPQSLNFAADGKKCLRVRALKQELLHITAVCADTMQSIEGQAGHFYLIQLLRFQTWMT